MEEISPKLKLYIDSYIDILNKYGLDIQRVNQATLKELIKLFFLVDDYYDSILSQDVDLQTIKNEFISFSDNELYKLNVEEYFENQFLENADNFLPKNIQEYLETTRRTIGTQVMYAYLLDKYNIGQRYVHQREIEKNYKDISIFLRLANDFLDYSKESERYHSETNEVKLINFIANRYLLFVWLLLLIFWHKAMFLFFLLKSRVIHYDAQKVMALKLMETLFDWGLFVFIRKKTSGRL